MLTHSEHRITKGPSKAELLAAFANGSKVRFDLDGNVVAFATIWGMRCNDSGRENWTLELKFGRRHFYGRYWIRRGRGDGRVYPR